MIKKSSEFLGAFWDTKWFQNDDVLRLRFRVGRRLMAYSSPTGCERGVFRGFEWHWPFWDAFLRGK